jgi:Tfp pilus assembly protein PilO
MNKDRLWTIGGIAAIAIVVIMGWLLGISPIVSQASAADDQVASLNQANTASVTKLASLKSQFANIGPLDDSLSALRQSIPQDANISAFIQEINTLCSKDNVKLTSVTVNNAVVYTAPIAPTPATPATGTSTPSPTPTPTPATAAGAAVVPAPAGSALVVVPVTVNISGTFQDVVAFVGDIQTGSRLYLINHVSTSTGSDAGGGAFTGVLSGNVFALPGASPVLPGDTPTPTATPTPSITPTAPPSSTSTPTPTGTPTP